MPSVAQLQQAGGVPMALPLAQAQLPVAAQVLQHPEPETEPTLR
jgi:hypothetical protein